MSTETIPPYPDQNADKQTRDKMYKARWDWEYENIYRGYISPDIITGIGRNAVQSSMDSAEASTNNQEFLIPQIEGLTQLYLQKTREKLHDVVQRDDTAKNLQQLLALEPLSPWLAGTMDVEQSGGGLVRKLTAQNPDGSYVVGNDTFLNVLEWHNHALADLQQSFDKEAPKVKDRFADTFFGAVSKGWIPESAKDNLQYLDDVSFVIDDGMRTTIDSTLGATAVRGNRDILVTLSPSKMYDESLHAHELLHVTAGRATEQSTFEDVGMKRVFGNGFGGVSMDEALVEHLASSMIKGAIDEVEPLASVRSGDTYFSQRGLLSALTKGGITPVDIRLFVNAYFENGNGEAEAALKKALSDAFPFTDVASEIAAMTDEPDAPADIYGYELDLLDRSRQYKESRRPLPRGFRFIGKRLGL